MMFNIDSLFLESEVAATTRSNMLHLQKMTDTAFIQFVQDVKQNLQGKLQGIPVSLKVDGLGARFGRDNTGRPFFEGSRTGAIFEPGAFSKYTAAKGGTPEMIARAQHYDDIFDVITQSNFIKLLPKDTKIVCEVFYNPLGEMVEGGIKFVNIAYDPSRLGQLMTIVPFKVLVASTGETHPNSDAIIDALFQQSTLQIKFVDTRLEIKGSIDISTVVDPVASLDAQAIATLNSRKRDDADAKAYLKQIVQQTKESLADFILSNPQIVDRFKLGPNIEGLVLNINGRDIKVTTSEFKQTIAAKKAQTKESTGFLQELVEARMFVYPENLKGRDAVTIARLLFCSMLALEIVRHENGYKAQDYVSRTMAFNDFDHMRPSATDLANLIAIVANQDRYLDEVKTKIGLYAPELQIKAHLRTFPSDINYPSRIRQFLLMLDEALMIAGSDLRQARRIIGDWANATDGEKKTAWMSLTRVFSSYGSQLDIYLLAKQFFSF
jgi:hypothetical protein